MGTQENGLAANIQSNLLAAVNISSSTNANPVVITTTGNHNLTTGDTVAIKRHQGNTPANGQWVATVLTNTTFSIPVAGIAPGGATGTVQSLAMAHTFTIPSDGVDAIAAASVNVPFEALADRSAFGGVGTGGLKLVEIQNFVLAQDAFTNWIVAAGPSGVNTWTIAVSGAGGYPLGPVDCFNTDFLVVDWHGLVIPQNGVGVTQQNTGIMFGLRNQWDSAFPTSWSPLPGASGIVSVTAGGGTPAAGTVIPVHYQGRLTTGSSQYFFGIGVYQLGATTGGITWSGSSLATVWHYRQTNMPQQ